MHRRRSPGLAFSTDRLGWTLTRTQRGSAEHPVAQLGNRRALGNTAHLTKQEIGERQPSASSNRAPNRINQTTDIGFDNSMVN